jgi:hypothetical protein
MWLDEAERTPRLILLSTRFCREVAEVVKIAGVPRARRALGRWLWHAGRSQPIFGGILLTLSAWTGSSRLTKPP